MDQAKLDCASKTTGFLPWELAEAFDISPTSKELRGATTYEEGWELFMKWRGRCSKRGEALIFSRILELATSSHHAWNVQRATSDAAVKEEACRIIEKLSAQEVAHATTSYDAWGALSGCVAGSNTAKRAKAAMERLGAEEITRATSLKMLSRTHLPQGSKVWDAYVRKQIQLIDTVQELRPLWCIRRKNYLELALRKALTLPCTLDDLRWIYLNSQEFQDLRNEAVRRITLLREEEEARKQTQAPPPQPPPPQNFFRRLWSQLMRPPR